VAEIQQFTTSWPPSNVLVADFNVNLLDASLPPSMLPRAGVIREYISRNHLSIMRPSNERAKLDHLCAMPNLVTSFETRKPRDLPVRTNHPALIYTVSTNTEVILDSQSSSTDRHYVLSPLRNPLTKVPCRALFERMYAAAQASVSQSLAMLWDRAIGATDDIERQLIADETDMVLLDALQMICDDLLYMHDETTRTPRVPDLSRPTSIIQSYLTLNAASQSCTSRRIVSDDKALTPIEACVKTWAHVWN